MKKRTQVLVTFLFVIVLVSGLYVFTSWFSLITGYFTGESEQARVANCLTDQGSEFYGTSFCADCEKQQNELGKTFETINYIDCGRDKQNCPNIESIPAWYIPNSEDKIHYGFKTINELKVLSGCE